MDGVVSLILSRHIMDYQPMYTILVDYLVFVARHQSLDVTAPLNQDVRARQLCFKDGCPRNLGNVDVVKVTDKIYIQFWEIDKRERDVLFNDALNTVYLWLFGIRHIVKRRKDGNVLFNDALTLAGTRNSSMGPPHEGSIRRFKTLNPKSI